MSEIFLPTLKNLNGPVDLQLKNGDPRKTAYVIGLMHKYRKAVKIYQQFGLMARIGDITTERAREETNSGHSLRRQSHDSEMWIRRRHMASEHMVTVIAGCQALGQLLQELDLFTERDIFDVEQAAAVHDAGKELEFQLVNRALQNEVTAAEWASILSTNAVRVQDQQVLLTLVFQYAPQLQSNVNKGSRGLAAYDLAGQINRLRLKEKNIKEEILEIQEMVGHASCPDIEDMVHAYETADDEQKKRILKILVMHYVDDITTNPNVIDPQITHDEDGNRLNALDRRCLQNEANPKYAEYNQAWINDRRNTTSETAFAMQRRVGHLVEKILAKVLGVIDPLMLPAVINERVSNNITTNWNKINPR